jgi:hypothetical protein
LCDRVRLFAGSHDAAGNGCNGTVSAGRPCAAANRDCARKTAVANQKARVNLIWLLLLKVRKDGSMASRGMKTWRHSKAYEERSCGRAGSAA